MMNLLSNENEIDCLVLKPLPKGRVVKVNKAFRAGGITVIVGENGKAYTDSVLHYAFTIGKRPWQDSLLRACVKLGLISQKSMDRHLQHAEQITKRKEWNYDVDQLKLHADNLGIEFTSRQKKLMKYKA